MTTTTNSGRARSREGGGRRRARGAAAPASERRDHLVRLAAELFAKKGFQATTVREIADEAGILSGSLYHHFDSKESIVDEILSNFYTELKAANRAAIEQGGPDEALGALVRIAFGTLEPHRAAITVLQNDWNYLKGLDRFAYLIKAEEDVEEMWITAIRSGQDAGLFRADLEPRLTYRMIRDTIWVTVRWFHTDGFDTEALTAHYLNVLLDGIHIH
ncbi:TetR/AcrR family transcriptional regulator [Actinocorallia libanotica]|uniref:TetR/AcrR family transcriptional regulator n=1 Tax=Actinocorallia libanotica TaxID=46162 RepID=A0ABN1REI8_9ACTN